MLSKFFKVKPQSGMPVSAIEAEGLAAMDHAWATLDVLGGHIDWSHGRPTIVTPSVSGPGLPAGGEEYQVLQRNGDGDAVWDWVRWPEPESE
jgi:hypothetical protein